MTDIPFDDVQRLDRSTAEDYSICPFMAFAKETKLVEDESLASLSGTAVHAALAALIDAYVMGADLHTDYAMQDALMARPDIQPDVLDGLRPSLWQITQCLRDYRPIDILRYQGGAGRRSGQMTRLICPGVVGTSEVDLMLATGAPTAIEIVDFKSGHTPHSTATIRRQFQFRFHAWLAFGNYEGLQECFYSVWMTRLGHRTGLVRFDRQDADDMQWRLREIVRVREEAHAGNPACWPAADRCPSCPALRICPKADPMSMEIATDPAAFAEATFVQQCAVDAQIAALKDYVKGHGPIEGRIAYRVKTPQTRTTYEFVESGEDENA